MYIPSNRDQDTTRDPSSPGFQEVASGGERVDSATLFTVVAVFGKGIDNEHPEDS